MLLVFSTLPPNSFFFFFNDTATTEIYTLSLHDALPISIENRLQDRLSHPGIAVDVLDLDRGIVDQDSDRKSTRLNSSHQIISYAVFCLKKKKIKEAKKTLHQITSGGHALNVRMAVRQVG